MYLYHDPNQRDVRVLQERWRRETEPEMTRLRHGRCLVCLSSSSESQLPQWFAGECRRDQRAINDVFNPSSDFLLHAENRVIFATRRVRIGLHQHDVDHLVSSGFLVQTTPAIKPEDLEAAMQKLASASDRRPARRPDDLSSQRMTPPFPPGPKRIDRGSTLTRAAWLDRLSRWALDIKVRVISGPTATPPPVPGWKAMKASPEPALDGRREIRVTCPDDPGTTALLRLSGEADGLMVEWLEGDPVFMVPANQLQRGSPTRLHSFPWPAAVDVRLACFLAFGKVP